MKNEWGMAPRSIGVAQLFIIHYSLFIIHYSLLIINYSFTPSFSRMSRKLRLR